MNQHHRPSFTLEPIVVAHAPEMFEALSDPLLYTYLEIEPWRDVSQVEATFTRWETRTSPDGQQAWLNWAIRLPTGDLAGYVQATVFEPTSSWIAYMLSPRHWGKGLARAATAAVIEHLEADHGVSTVLACIEQANARSIALVQALGFEPASPAQLARRDLSPSEVLYVLRAGSNDEAGPSPPVAVPA
jgi:ribosomal-protein-alanine N-acetyltransferase